MRASATLLACSLLATPARASNPLGDIDFSLRGGDEWLSREWGQWSGWFVDGEVEFGVTRHWSIALFGATARTSDHLYSLPTGWMFDDAHSWFFDAGVRGNLHLGPFFVGAGLGAELTTYAETDTSLGTLDPPGTFSSTATSTGWLLDLHVGFAPPVMIETPCRCSPQLFLSYDYEPWARDGTVVGASGLRLGLGVTFH